MEQRQIEEIIIRVFKTEHRFMSPQDCLDELSVSKQELKDLMKANPVLYDLWKMSPQQLQGLINLNNFDFNRIERFTDFLFPLAKLQLQQAKDQLAGVRRNMAYT